jgi:DNA-binding XRE family transcriptional regulator
MPQYFYKKLSGALNDTAILEGFELLLNAATKPGAFTSKQEFLDYITEGALLNVNALGSKNLSIPCGEYQIWLTEAGHPMLVPTSDNTMFSEVFDRQAENYEVNKKDLANNYQGFNKATDEDNKLNISEEGDEDKEDEDEEYKTDAELDNENDSEYVKRSEDKTAKFELAVDKNTVDRTPLMKAMEDKRLTITDLADQVGVDPPAISRILRQPTPGPGDPGGRNPSMELAAKICSALSIDPKNAFPDFFGSKRKK